MDDLEAGLHTLDVDERRQADRAMAVQLDGSSSGGGDEVRRELADGVGCEQATGVLQVQPVHLGAVGERGRALGVVLMRVDRADRVRQADHDLLDALGLRHRGDPLEPIRVVRGVGDLEAAQSVADDSRSDSAITSGLAGIQEMNRMPVVIIPSGVSGIAALTRRIRSQGSS